MRQSSATPSSPQRRQAPRWSPPEQVAQTPGPLSEEPTATRPRHCPRNQRQLSPQPGQCDPEFTPGLRSVRAAAVGERQLLVLTKRALRISREQDVAGGVVPLRRGGRGLAAGRGDRSGRALPTPTCGRRVPRPASDWRRSRSTATPPCVVGRGCAVGKAQHCERRAPRT